MVYRQLGLIHHSFTTNCVSAKKTALYLLGAITTFVLLTGLTIMPYSGYITPWKSSKGESRLLKGGHSQTCHHCWCRVSYTHSMRSTQACKACHQHYRGSGGMPPRKCWKITPYELKFKGIFSKLSIFDVPVDTGTQNFLKFLVYCLHAYPCWVMLQRLLYIEIVMLLLLKLLMPLLMLL